MPGKVTDRLDEHDRQIAAIREMVREGMRLVIETRKDLRTLARLQMATAEAQKATDASLKELIESLRGGGNGHTNGKTKK